MTGKTIKSERQIKAEELAKEVLVLSRNTLMVRLRFLDAALNQFDMHPYRGTYAVVAGHIFYDPMIVLGDYRKEKEIPVRVYLHLVLHCVFQHMYGAENLNQKLWDLSCDIAVEHTITELELKETETKRSKMQNLVFEELRSATKDRLTAEYIYEHYLENNLCGSDLEYLQELFRTDDHNAWYMTDDDIKEILSTESDEDQDEKEKNESDGSDGNNDSPNELPKDRMEEVWKDISERMQTEMETFAREKGAKALGMMQNLKSVNREKYDYTEFLKKFAVLGETVKVNDDEFDYIFYTYGLDIYDNLPLVEPLEYKEVKRISDFVIAIDTSGSVSGDLVQAFVEKTYNILKSTESFFSRINLRIMQCDTEIKEEVRITSQEEFDRYIKEMKLVGFGGTDFRPVFERTNELIMNKEMLNLKGLIYFTDGYGVFPEKMPAYKTAFVFMDDGINDAEVPAWAIKAVISKNELKIDEVR